MIMQRIQSSMMETMTRMHQMAMLLRTLNPEHLFYRKLSLPPSRSSMCPKATTGQHHIIFMHQSVVLNASAASLWLQPSKQRDGTGWAMRR
jgi:hypothetical protein